MMPPLVSSVGLSGDAGLQVSIPPSELVQLCAIDSELFNKTFFPGAFRQACPAFHREMDELLEDQQHQYVGFAAFRDSAKTTKLRAYTAKRIAYGVSRTILYVSKTQDHAILSLQWLKKAIEHNAAFTQLFGLSKGSRWKEELIEIHNSLLDINTTVIALGITGQTRGINIDDWRPDLILIDDPLDEENTATPEQRKKVDDVVFGALFNSLSPRSESPDAKMVLLQTPLNAEDLISKAIQSKSWETRVYSCFDGRRESRWPARWSTEELLQKKQVCIDEGHLLTWLREKECCLVSGESADFRQEWLRYWETIPTCMKVLAIDPVPPPSDREVAKGLVGKDQEVLCCAGGANGNVYLLEFQSNTGHTPEWTTTTFFSMIARWRPLRARVEGVAYQRTLKWVLEQAMKVRRTYLQINCPSDRRAKRHRILQALSGIASQGRLFVHPSMHTFISQFCSYGPGYAGHDDELDCAAMAIEELQEGGMLDELGELDGPEEKALELAWRGAP